MGRHLSSKTWDFIKNHAEENVQRLALQASRYPDVDMLSAIVQIAARQKAKVKLPTWWRTEGICYPPRLSMEQCSSEITARYKADLVPETMKTGSFTDLSGGFGVDFCCMARGFSRSTYVERQEQLCALATQNFPLLGLPEAHVVKADAVEYLKTMPEQSVIFVDPARRDTKGKKLVAVSDCEPNLSALAPLLLEKTGLLIAKLSPMLDISQALEVLPGIREVHVVAVSGECKEVLLVMERGASSGEARIVSVNLPETLEQGWPEPFIFTRQEEAACTCLMAESLGRYLYEPHAAILKAGAFRCIAHRYGVRKLHPNSHLYTGEELLPEFPGRSFEIVSCGGFGKKELRELHERVPKANLTVRNFPSTAEQLRKRLKLADGGYDYLFATTLSDGERCWIRCKRAKQ